ncbi:phosphate transport system substrate-binding protein [Marmoricola sp. OAE513]|uniref:phosphate ABC transporter substrate-binding protein PstS n=1 Tax=Marmoricola sp. OAE513 TaxID=2817894 RepID=UPI001AE93733
MNSTAIRRIAAPSIAALTLGLSLAACGDNASDGGAAAGDLSGKLAGAGASSQEKAQEAWSVGFQGLNEGVTVTYDPLGSGDGRKQFIAKGVLFAGSDSALNDDEGELSAAKERCGGEDPIEVPAYVSPIAVAFNLDGVDALNLDAKTIAQIFDNKITKWNDPAIVAQNPDAKLPATAISPVHRGDDSGTTKNFTDYLGKAGDGAWKYEAADAFPVKGGEAAEGTSGVIAAITNGKGTIGYADESQVGDLSVVSVKVGDTYTAPSAEGAAKVVAISPAAEGRPDVDMAVALDRTTTEAGAYPVVLLSYLIACQHYDNENDAALVKGYLSYAVSEDGQAAAKENAGSAPLDAEVAAKAQSIVDKIAAK